MWRLWWETLPWGKVASLLCGHFFLRWDITNTDLISSMWSLYLWLQQIATSKSISIVHGIFLFISDSFSSIRSNWFWCYDRLTQKPQKHKLIFQGNYDQANILNWTIWANRGEWMMISVYLVQIQWLPIHPIFGHWLLWKGFSFFLNWDHIYMKNQISYGPRVKQRLWHFLLVNWFCVNSGDKDRDSGDKWGWAKSNQAQLYFSGKGVHSSVDAFCTHRNIYRKRLR